MKIIYDENFFYKNILNLKTNDEIKKMASPEDQYNKFILRKNGKSREIYGIKSRSRLYSLQRRFLENFLEDIPLPNHVCGFVKEKNYIDFLKVHCGKKYFLRVDIKDFFNSIKSIDILNSLDDYIKINDEIVKSSIEKDILKIVSLNDKLPQGAVTSPKLSNLFFRRIDLRIRKYCRKLNVEYTRYADDMLFSSDDLKLHQDYFFKKIRSILKEFNLETNKKKIIKTTDEIVLNGYIINEKISLSRKKLKKIKAFIYAYNYKDGKRNKCHSAEEYTYRIAKLKRNDYYTTDDLYTNYTRVINYLAGYRSYLITFSKTDLEDYVYNYNNIIKEIEFILDKLSKEKIKYNKDRKNIIIMMDKVNFGRVDGFFYEVRKVQRKFHKTKIFYTKVLNMNFLDRSLMVNFKNSSFDIDLLLNEIEDKALKCESIQTNIQELKYAININFYKGRI